MAALVSSTEDTNGAAEGAVLPPDGYQYGFEFSDDDEDRPQPDHVKQKESGGKCAKGKGGDGKKEAKNPFTQYYAQLLHQQNMLQDGVRTGTYQNAFMSNKEDFNDKVVLDVGTGTGILAFFAIQAGARKVYAVEASNMAQNAERLVKSNGMEGRIIVLRGILEDIELPEKVDIIISEPIGFLLVHERMLETYIVARDKFLKPSGLMMPTVGDIVLSPYTDEALFNEQVQKTVFWQSPNFYGVDLTCLREKALDEYFAQPVVGYIHSGCLLSRQFVRHRVNFSTCTRSELQSFDVPFRFVAERTAIMHGLACWFDVEFQGTTSTVVLSTNPEAPGTHWYQCRLMLREPVAVNRTQTVSGNLHFEANNSFSYTISFDVQLDGTTIGSTCTINLQDQMYHYLTHADSAVSHGSYH